MRKLLFLFLGVCCCVSLQAQVTHLFEHTYPAVEEEHPQIRTLMNKVSIDSLAATLDHLQSYHTRRWDSRMVYEVQDWLFDQYREMDFDTVYLHDFLALYHDTLYETSDNVIAVRKGLLYPDEYVVCGAHYDSYNMFEGHPDSLRAPGADDNASGVSGIMETARILKDCTFERSVIFCNFAAEEIGLLGSAAYAKECAEQYMDIVAYFNLDMIGYLEEGSDIHVKLLYTGRDSLLANYVYDFCRTYYPDMEISHGWLSGGSDSDFSSFNRNGYQAVHPFEDTHHYSPYIHTPDDIVGLSVNSMEQVKRFTELNLGFVATLAGLISNGVEDHKDSPLIVYPNPVTESFTVKGVPIREVSVYNLMGQRLVSHSFFGEECRMDVSFLVPGIYFIQVLQEDGMVFTEKLIKN